METVSIICLFLIKGAHTPKKTIEEIYLFESSGLLDFKNLSKPYTILLAYDAPNFLIRAIPHYIQSSINICKEGSQNF